MAISSFYLKQATFFTSNDIDQVKLSSGAALHFHLNYIKLSSVIAVYFCHGYIRLMIILRTQFDYIKLINLADHYLPRRTETTSMKLKTRITNSNKALNPNM